MKLTLVIVTEMGVLIVTGLSLLFYYGFLTTTEVAIELVLLLFFVLAINGSSAVQARLLQFSIKNSIPFFSLHIASAFVLAFFWNLFSYFGYYVVQEQNPDFFSSSVPPRTFGLVVLYLFVTVQNYLFQFYRDYSKETARSAELREAVTQTELESLKLQLNPHFLFNGLNSLASLIGKEPTRARDMIVQLAEFLRYSLKTKSVKIPLCEELIQVERYLAIEKIRFYDKINYVQNVNVNCNDFLMPIMILQPLFENAVKHGVYDALESVTIELVVSPVNNDLKITLTNTIESEEFSKPGAGVGLKNIENRLRLIYGDSASIKISKQPKLFSVSLIIPRETTNG